MNGYDLDNLKNTRDIDIYLDSLYALKERYLIILSVKDTPGNKMPENIFKKAKEIGFSQLTKDLWRTYIGIIDCGKTIFDKSGERAEIPIEYSYKLSDVDLFVSSKAFRQGNLSQIVINGEDYSLNSRGWNIVVFDFKSHSVIDSSSYDGHLVKPTFYHRNLELDSEFFNTHFFVPDKYKEIWTDPFKKLYISNLNLNVREIENGVVLPLKPIKGRKCGGACDEKYNLLAGYDDYSHDAMKDPHVIPYAYVPNENEVDFVNETVLYGGVIFNHPGHLILQTLANRLWYIEHISPNMKIAIILRPWGFEPKNFLFEIMEECGFSKDRFIIITKPTKFKKLLIPDASLLMYMTGTPYYYTKECCSFFQFIKSKIVPSKYKKIYFTKRKNDYKPNIVGEEYFIDFYKRHGFEIIDPEDFNMAEKISFMLGAEEFVTVAGTNSFYTFFCKPTTRITILTRVDNNCYCTLVESMICQMIKCKNFYIVNVATEFIHKDFVWGVTLLSLTDDFKKYAEQVYNEKIEITPKEALKTCLYTYLEYLPNYYSQNPTYFNTIKNQKMLTVLQNISEVFCGKDFDTSKLNLTTNEDNLRNQVKQLTDELTKSKNEIKNILNSDIYKTAKFLEDSKGKAETNFDNQFSNAVFDISESFANIKNSFAEKEKINNKLQEEIKELSLKNQALQETTAKLSDDLKASQKECESLQRDNGKIKELSLKNQALQETITKLSDDLKASQKECEALKKDNGKIKELSLKNQALQETTAKLSDDLKASQKECESLQRDNSGKQMIINGYENSRSWRITKPLRLTKKLVCKLFRK